MLRRIRKHIRRKLSLRKSSNGHERRKDKSERNETESERSKAELERSEAETGCSEVKTELFDAESEQLEAESGSAKAKAEPVPEHSKDEAKRYEAQRKRLHGPRHCNAVTTPPVICCKATTMPSTEQASDVVIQAELAGQTPDSEICEAPSPPSVRYSYDSEPSSLSAPLKAPSVRIAEQCRLHPHTDSAVSAVVDRCLPEGKTYLMLKAELFHLATVGRTLVTPGPSRRTVGRLLNLSNRPVNIHAGTIIAVLVPAERATRSTEYNKSDEGVWPKVNFDSIPDVERGLLGCLLTQKRHLFANETGRIPFEDREPPAINSETLDPVEQEPTNDLLTYLAECRPARNTFPFPTEPCAVRCVNDASWQLAMSYADRHIPRRFHATLHLPTEVHLPSTAPKARYITTLTPLHHNVSDALPFHELRRLVELCTSALNYPLLRPDYAQAATDLERIFFAPWQSTHP